MRVAVLSDAHGNKAALAAVRRSGFPGHFAEPLETVQG